MQQNKKIKNNGVKSQSGKALSNIFMFLFVILLLGILVFIVYLMFGEGRKYLDSFTGSFNQTNEQIKISDNPLDTNYNQSESNSGIVHPNAGASTDSQIDNKINTNKYFYNQLTTQGKDIYNIIENNIDKLQKNEKIEFPSSMTKNINTIEQVGLDFQSAWDALNLDRQDIFYIETDKLSLNTKTVTFLSKQTHEVTIEPKDGGTYYTKQIESYDDLINKINQLEQTANQIVSSAPSDTIGKIKHVHDWLVDNVSYDKSFDNQRNANTYGTLVVKNTVCKGYADSFKYLLDKLGIQNVIIYGMAYADDGSEESHAWNYVLLENGNWYAVDVTWDDPIIYGNGKLTNKEKYKYYLKGSNSFFQNHKEDGNVSGAGQIFEYPIISTTDF